MIFVSKLDFGLFRECILKLLVDNNVSDIALFKDDTVLSKFVVQLVHHSVSHIGFKIEYIHKPNTLNEISDIFFNLCCEKLIEPTGTKFVNKSFNLLLILWKSECEMDVNINISVILGWASLNWSIIVNNIFGKHACNSLIEAIAPVSTSLHDTS
jgi:hypothetical protein